MHQLGNHKLPAFAVTKSTKTQFLTKIYFIWIGTNKQTKHFLLRNHCVPKQWHIPKIESGDFSSCYHSYYHHTGPRCSRPQTTDTLIKFLNHWFNMQAHRRNGRQMKRQTKFTYVYFSHHLIPLADFFLYSPFINHGVMR